MARPAVPVLTMESPREFIPMRWLLVPPWIDRSEKMRELKIWTANARIEEIESKKLYAGLTRGNRCLILFAGFYEWRHEDDKTKTKYYLHLPDDAPMFLPGIYRDGEIDGLPYRSCSVCTMEARNVMRYIHNGALRQPVVVEYAGDGGSAAVDHRSAGGVWLDPDASLCEARRAVLNGELSGVFESSPSVESGQLEMF